MDKPKILIVGAGPSSASLARLLGTALSEHSIAIVEDHKRLLEQMDYTDLECRIASQIPRQYWGKSRYVHPQFDQIPVMGKSPDLVIYDDFELPKAADHPSRKREPKGPRGKWGKL